MILSTVSSLNPGEFHFDEFIRAFIYHILLLLVTGPLTILIVYPIEGYYYAQNMVLIPTREKHKLPFFIAQQVQYLSWILYVIFFCLSYSQQIEEEREIGCGRMPLIFIIFMLTVRAFIIAIKYGARSPDQVHLNKTTILHEAAFYRQLIQ